MSVENGSNLGSPAKRKSGMFKPKFKDILNLWSWRICPVAGLIGRAHISSCQERVGNPESRNFVAKKTGSRAGRKIADLEGLQCTLCTGSWFSLQPKKKQLINMQRLEDA